MNIQSSHLATTKPENPQTQFELGIPYYERKEYGQATDWWRKAAEQGHIEAQFELGNLYDTVHNNYSSAVDWWREAANQGHHEAQFKLGLAYFEGNGIAQNCKKAWKLWLKLANQTHVQAQFELGRRRYLNSQNIHHYLKAVKWLCQAAHQEHAGALFYLGEAYYYGRGLTLNYEYALECYEYSASEGDHDAQQKLWTNPQKHNEEVQQLTPAEEMERLMTTQEYVKAVKWSALANHRDIEAKYHLGVAFENGEGVIENAARAFELWREAAELGHSEAQVCFGLAYYKGKVINRDYSTAIYWLEEAAKQNNTNALFHLGLAYYEKKENIESNLKEALKYWHEAAKLGEAKAQYRLGNAYYHGQGTERNQEKAIQWWLEAGKQGHNEAQFELGIAYYEREQYEQAIDWLRQAAEQGHPKAQYRLGKAYYQGQGTEKNQEKAIQWWLEAGKQGYVTAQYNLGVAYLDGLGVDKDTEKAREWFLEVAEQHDDKNPLVISAQYQLGILYKSVPNYQEARLWLNRAIGLEQGKNGFSEKDTNFFKVVLDEKNERENLITIVRSSAYEALDDITKLEEQEKANKKLTRSYEQIKAEKRKIEGLVKDYSHTLANEIHPQNILNVADTLKQQGLKKEALLLYKAYHGEIFIWHQNELLLTKYRNASQFRQKVLENRAEANSDSAADTTVSQILNDALEKSTLNFLDKTKYKVLLEVRRRMFGDNLESLSEYYDQFINHVSLDKQDALEWVRQNLMPIQLSYRSEKWAQIRVQKYKCTEALLHKHFYELFINIYKYSDFKGVELRFFEEFIDERAYLRSEWTNTYEDNKSISTGNGLEGIKEDLKSLNEGDACLSCQDDKEHKTFSVTLAIQEELLYLPPVLFDVQLPV